MTSAVDGLAYSLDGFFLNGQLVECGEGSRKELYLTIAGPQESIDSRSVEAILVHFTGGLIITEDMKPSLMESLQGCCFIIARDLTGKDIVISAAAETPSALVCRASIGNATPGWINVPSMQKQVSKLVIVPDEWKTSTFWGQFSEPMDQVDVEEDEDSYETCPQFVISVPGPQAVNAIVSLELLDDKPYADDFGFDIYGVPGEEYEMIDDPREFWNAEYMCNSCEPALQRSCTIIFSSELVYMVVPRCSQPIGFVLRFAYDDDLEIVNFDDASSMEEDMYSDEDSD